MQPHSGGRIETSKNARFSARSVCDDQPSGAARTLIASSSGGGRRLGVEGEAHGRFFALASTADEPALDAQPVPSASAAGHRGEVWTRPGSPGRPSSHPSSRELPWLARHRGDSTGTLSGPGISGLSVMGLTVNPGGPGSLAPPLQRSSPQAAPSATPISVKELAYSMDCRTMSTNSWMAPVDRRLATQSPSS